VAGDGQAGDGPATEDQLLRLIGRDGPVSVDAAATAAGATNGGDHAQSTTFRIARGVYSRWVQTR
jgi:hypothetical protein